jgi:hypothetical protein
VPGWNYLFIRRQRAVNPEPRQPVRFVVAPIDSDLDVAVSIGATGRFAGEARIEDFVAPAAIFSLSGLPPKDPGLRVVV